MNPNLAACFLSGWELLLWHVGVVMGHGPSSLFTAQEDP